MTNKYPRLPRVLVEDWKTIIRLLSVELKADIVQEMQGSESISDCGCISGYAWEQYEVNNA